MMISLEDTFCLKKQLVSGAQYSDTLDFQFNGDDILGKLAWYVHCSKAAADTSLTIEWQTSDDEAFTSPTAIDTKSIAASALTKGAYVVNKEVLPRGLKRYNRLKLTGTAGSDSSVTTKVYPIVSASLVLGRDLGTPVTEVTVGGGVPFMG